MEAVGLVLGAVPIIIRALQSYKSGKTLTDRVRNRKKHIAELIRALQGYQATLEGYLAWVLKGADVEIGENDDVTTVTALFANQAVADDVKEFLGSTAANALIDTLEACQEALSAISQSIDDFLPASGAAADPQSNVRLIAQKYAGTKEVAVWKGIKLAFSRSELDAQIRKVDSCTNILDKIQSNRTAIGQLESNKPTRKSKHVVRALSKIGWHAERLHKALVSGWAPGCHENHEVKLFLEDRLQDSRPKPKLQKVYFRLIFAGEGHQGKILWHDNHVYVLEGEENELPNNPASAPAGPSPHRSPKVAIVAPCGHTPKVPAPKRMQVQNICLCIAEAQRSSLHLELYLLSHSTIHYCHSTKPAAPHAVKAQATVNLEELIRTSSAAQSRSQKLPLTSRLRLALVLASTTLQLGSTAWLKQSWSKNNVCFMDAENLSEIDLSHPTLCEHFPDTRSTPNGTTTSTSARSILLELGIILLELWNETTLEQHYDGTDSVVRKEYFNRLSLAQQWLEDSEDHILPVYYDAVARLVKCHFDGIPVNPSWDDQNLQSGLVRTVIEPLQRQCRVDT